MLDSHIRRHTHAETPPLTRRASRGGYYVMGVGGAVVGKDKGKEGGWGPDLQPQSASQLGANLQIIHPVAGMYIAKM